MPVYDLACPECGHEMPDIYAGVQETVCCAMCGAPTVRVWATSKGRGGDVTWPGGKTFENLGNEPQTFYSKSEYQRYLRNHRIEEFVRHVPIPGSDKSPHTTSWAAVSAETLAGAKAMLERTSTAPDPVSQPTYIRSFSVTVTNEIGTIRAPKGTFDAA